ncbi:amyloid-beta A4 precursor protein-binding family A member 2 isoform X1 [Clarias gariepinus]|uniref:amyloid-beta A4 precursor protein-binding family A member 2 isoform X1 n=1 Tax=Clarias gariepinus TaxID=13013 RepID=UPI00234CEF0A|nr:amyloid-beta A4 precursor protein-binding family A member 2 isoform X1 [Clarias gariepinus]XP_053368337.1 amyloid-beta A4 precursor protein-binding family A member 2 isoform X1 [Clarias gariepinus]
MPVMALRQSQGSRAMTDCPQYISSVPDQAVKHSRDREDFEEPHSSNTESQSSTPVPASYCPTEGSVSGEDFDHEDSPNQHDSMEEDSLSEYDNVKSEEEDEQDYEEDEELHTDADGMTYYVHCCPEDESYLEGMDCHEVAERPSTSRKPPAGESSDAWEFSEGFYGMLQQGTEDLVHKGPKPSTESFIHAPMAEDEEDDEDDAEDVEEEDENDDDEEEDPAEEDETCFAYEQGKAGGSQDEIICKGQCDLREHSKNPHRGSNSIKGMRVGDKGLSKDYTVDKNIPEKCTGDSQRSIICHREGNQKTNAEVKADHLGNFEVARAETNSKQRSVFRRHQICKDDKGSKNRRINSMTKHEDTDNSEDLKKRHSYKDHGREKREDKCLHVGDGSSEDSTSRGQRCPHSNRAKTGRDTEQSVGTDEDMNQVVNEIKTKMKVGPQSSEIDRGIVEKSCNERRIPESSQVSALRPHSEESRLNASNTPMSALDSRLQNDPVRLTKEDCLRSSKGQVTQNSPQHGTINPRSETNTTADNCNLPQQGKKNHSFPSFVDVPGPCEPEDLIDGIIFAANYLGSTQLLSDRNPSKSVRMMQAQEAVDRVKCGDKESQSPIEVDLFISTKAIKVLNADTQETMIDNALRTISYIADIGSVVVLMARRRVSQSAALDCNETSLNSAEARKQYRMICYVFESEDAQLIAQSIGQAFSMAYQEFLRANGINPKDLSQKDYSDILNSQEMYNDDLIHFSNSENCKELHLEKQKGEILGVVIVESGWGSILPTVILACMLNSGPAARSGKLNVGDQIMAVNDTSLVGLPLATCQSIIKGLKNQLQVKLSVVSCPPVTTVLIKRPDLQYPLGFSVQNGIICSLMRGGIAERGGVRVGHRIIEINGQSVVAMAHEKIVHALSVSVGEIHMKTMPAVMFRLLTGQETPMYI